MKIHKPLKELLLNVNTYDFKVCQTCYKTLREDKIPRVSRPNGFVYQYLYTQGFIHDKFR